MGVGGQKFKLRQQVGEREKIGGLGEEDVVLEEDGHPDGADQRREARRLAQGFVGDLFHGKPVGGGINDGENRRQDENGKPRKSFQGQNAGDDQRGEGPDHVDFAMGEIDQLDDAVHHGVAEGDQGVDAAPGQSPDQKLQKIIH